MSEFRVVLEGRVAKIEEDEKHRVAYVRLGNADKVTSRLFEALSGGPTIAVIVPANKCRVGDSATVEITLRSTS